MCVMALALTACQFQPTSQDVGFAVVASVFPALAAAYLMHVLVSLVRYETFKLSIPKRIFHVTMLSVALYLSIEHLISPALDAELFPMMCCFISLAMAVWASVVWLVLYAFKALRKHMDVVISLATFVLCLLPAVALEQQWVQTLPVETSDQIHFGIFLLWVAVPVVISWVPLIVLMILVERERRAARREDDLAQQVNKTSEVFS